MVGLPRDEDFCTSTVTQKDHWFPLSISRQVLYGVPHRIIGLIAQLWYGHCRNPVSLHGNSSTRGLLVYSKPHGQGPILDRWFRYQLISRHRDLTLSFLAWYSSVWFCCRALGQVPGNLEQHRIGMSRAVDCFSCKYSVA